MPHPYTPPTSSDRPRIFFDLFLYPPLYTKSQTLQPPTNNKQPSHPRKKMHSLIPTILLALLSVLISALPSPTNTNTTLCGTFKKDFNTTGDRPFYATQTCETTPIAEGYMFLDFLDSCTCNYWA